METNRRIGDYEVLEELGRGGMGRVYRVRNVISDRIEAMKVLLPDLVGRQDLAARFLREIKLLAALDHPNIAALRTALTADNQLVMIMEFVAGQTLAHRLKQGAIPVADALNYLGQALDALSYAHARHVVHRDIKPANMMLTPDGTVKLTDFGIARQRNDQTLTVAGTTTGSLSYMSPEQVNGETTDSRSDLYSVGISLYEMVTGQRPFQADSDFAVMVAHLKEQPRPPIDLLPSLSADLNQVILTSIAKDPNRRFQSAAEFREAISRIQSGASAQPAIDRSAQTTIVGTIPQSPAAARSVGEAMPVAEATGTRTAGSTRTPVAPPEIPPVAVPPIPVPPPVTKQGHPALYVVLGGVLVLGALVGAGLYIGRAEAKPTPATATAPAPASTPASPAPVPPAPTPAPSPTVATTPTPAAPITEPPAAAAAPVTSATPGTTAPAATSSPAAPAASLAPAATTKPAVPKQESQPRRAASPPSAPQVTEQPSAPAAPPQPVVDFDALEDEIDQLQTRAAAVNRSLDVLQQEQARLGLGLRGDIAARQESMNLNLTRARESIGQRNVTRVQRFKTAAESDVEALERFLGR